jgi:branched-chain amino acid transport system permease protein
VTDFLDAIINGACVGAAYALIGLGFVIIYKATGVLNFAEGAMMLFGAYMAYNAHVTWGIEWYLSMLIAVVAGALFGMLLEQSALRFLVGQPVFAQIMVTIGLAFVIQEILNAIWGGDALNMNDPWGLTTVTIFGAIVSWAYIWRLILAAIALSAFFVFFRYSRSGTAMRATAADQEAAMAQGVRLNRVYLTAWGISGACAALAGICFTTGSSPIQPTTQYIALAAFPAIILGGLDSPGGAVVGGLTVGILQNLAAQYVPQYFTFMGSWTEGFDAVVPYLVLLLILLVKPYGLFGTKEVRRV